LFVRLLRSFYTLCSLLRWDGRCSCYVCVVTYLVVGFFCVVHSSILNSSYAFGASYIIPVITLHTTLPHTRFGSFSSFTGCPCAAALVCGGSLPFRTRYRAACATVRAALVGYLDGWLGSVVFTYWLVLHSLPLLPFWVPLHYAALLHAARWLDPVVHYAQLVLLFVLRTARHAPRVAFLTFVVAVLHPLPSRYYYSGSSLIHDCAPALPCCLPLRLPHQPHCLPARYGGFCSRLRFFFAIGVGDDAVMVIPTTFVQTDYIWLPYVVVVCSRLNLLPPGYSHYRTVADVDGCLGSPPAALFTLVGLDWLDVVRFRYYHLRVRAFPHGGWCVRCWFGPCRWFTRTVGCRLRSTPPHTFLSCCWLFCSRV